MEIGAFILAQQRSYDQPSEQVILNSIEQTQACEAAGFSTAWYAEHHFNNYSLVPSPLQMVAACSGRTSRIRLGTAVCVLPLYQPQRLLSEIGFADIVTGGRLDLGVGSGYQQFEFERFGVDVDNAPEVFLEHLEIIEKGLKQKIFEHNGKHITIPPTAIAVRNVQKPHVPIWIAAGSPRSMTRAYKSGHNLFVTALQEGLDQIAVLRDQIGESAEAAGKSVKDARVAFLRCAYASDNDAEIEHYLDCARFQRRLSEALHKRRQQMPDGYLLRETPTEKDVPLEQLRKNLPVGSVNQVIDRMLEEISILKPDQVAIQTQLGDFDQKTMLKQIEVWGERIIPAIQKEVGATAIAAQ
ncbi:LLM class flavin-dependent oxidoreductase [Gemmobacter sp.]|uniref:LLM class flavin-dependent oxidoreductase n=1 Tax=Gemmobacter sp. TaxID=1898957 RepID=UPI002AFFFA6A|nr:LLM class flavin-dependent oxidoreductase [Gemmobacter sp.]